MKKITLTLLLGFLALLSVSAFTVLFPNGSAIGYTQSPADGGGGDCSDCHSGGIAAPVPSFASVPAFGAGNTYVPGATYTISVTVTGYPGFGFDLEMLNGQLSASTDAGTFVAGANTLVHPPSTYPTNITHKTPIKLGSYGQFLWTSPASGENVYVYAAFNGVNLDGTPNGDKCVDFTQTLLGTPTGIASGAASTPLLTLFPNPASDELHITYSLAKNSRVLICLFDLRGQLVAQLLDQTQEPGEQLFDANLPTGLGQGIYTLCLSVDGVVTMKWLVVR